MPSSSGTAPLDAPAFAPLIEALGPFEPRPHLAVAVSGGRDSLALALLADEWVRGRGGRVTALIVDHRLRPESSAEACQAAALLAGRGIEAAILVRPGEVPPSRVEERAREARYALLLQACRARGILHLLLAHHQADQAETVLLRLGRGSGLEGLAAMGGIAETASTRLLRPLLGVPRERLAATLERRGLKWIDDPSNSDPRFARVRLRHVASADTLAGAAAVAARCGADRQALERRLGSLLAEIVSLHPAGFAWLRAGRLLGLPDELAARVLARIAATIGGRIHPPRREAVAGALARLRAGRSTTMGGCRVLVRGGRLLVVREAAAIGPPRPLGDDALFDGRFAIDPPPGAEPGLWVGALGEGGRRTLLQGGFAAAAGNIPAAAWPSLPALWKRIGDSFTLAMAPLVAGLPSGRQVSGAARVFPALPVRYRPRLPLLAAPFVLVLPAAHLI